MAPHTITLAGNTDSDGFRREARALLAALVAPDEVDWVIDAGAAAQRFSRPAGPAGSRAATSAGITHPLVPRSFMSMCETVILHNAPLRFGLLYRLLWRLVHEPGLLHDPRDRDRVQALHMAQAVRRDMRKMKTLVHFSVVDDTPGTQALYLAWFDPDHHVVEAVAPFFARRFAQLRWAILTPERSVRWQGQMLEFGPGAPPIAAADRLGRYRDVFGDLAARRQPALNNGRGSAPARSSRPGSAP
jgi:DNA polymerase